MILSSETLRIAEVLMKFYPAVTGSEVHAALRHWREEQEGDASVLVFQKSVLERIRELEDTVNLLVEDRVRDNFPQWDDETSDHSWLTIGGKVYRIDIKLDA